MDFARRDNSEFFAIVSRIVHASTTKGMFDHGMEWLGTISPWLSYALRTSAREAAFPLRPGQRESDKPPGLRDDISIFAGIFSSASANFKKVVSPYRNEIRWSRGRVFNGFFETIDAELYYSMIRYFTPRLVVEVGAGNSTWFSRSALRENRTGELWAIDPAPRMSLPRQCHLLRKEVQDVPISFFRNLIENDILFIDAGHTEVEANYYVEAIYPNLRPGVFIHHHDIVFPYLGYGSFVPDWRSFGEQEVILEFLSDARDTYEIFTSSAFVCYENPLIVSRLVPSKVHKPQVVGGSTWIRKKA